MAKHTKIVVGTYWDGCSDTDTDTVAKKIQDAIDLGTASVEFVSIAVKGRRIVASISYTTA